MLALYWIVRIYRWWLFAWVIMTWIPGLAGSELHRLLGIPVMPILAPFSFLSTGMVSLAPLIPAIALGYLERYLARELGLVPEESTHPVPVDPSVEIRDLKPVEPPSPGVGI